MLRCDQKVIFHLSSNLILGSVLPACCRGISPTVREGSVAIRVGALPYGRASARLRSSNTLLGHYPHPDGGGA